MWGKPDHSAGHQILCAHSTACVGEVSNRLTCFYVLMHPFVLILGKVGGFKEELGRWKKSGHLALNTAIGAAGRWALGQQGSCSKCRVPACLGWGILHKTPVFETPVAVLTTNPLLSTAAEVPLDTLRLSNKTRALILHLGPPCRRAVPTQALWPQLTLQNPSELDSVWQFWAFEPLTCWRNSCYLVRWIHSTLFIWQTWVFE